LGEADLKTEDELLSEAMKLSGMRKKREVVTLALQEFVNRRRQLQLLELEGKIDYDSDYDYKQQRRRA
jgi:Arc/MetJ family transcription regulator